MARLVDDRDRAKGLMKRPDKHCTYCGDWYQCLDHPIPVSSTGLPRSYRRGEVVPSCTECNGLLGSKGISEINDQAYYLLHAYNKKKRWLLSLPEWKANELAEFGYGLRIQMKRYQYLKQIYRTKVANLNLVLTGNEPIAIHDPETAFLSDE